MKKYIIALCLIAGMGSGLSAQVTKTAAELAALFPGNFVDRTELEQVFNSIDSVNRGVRSETFDRISSIRDRVEFLQRQRAEMLAIQGVDEASDAIRSLDSELVMLEKEMNDLLHDDGILHWRTLVAAGIGGLVGWGIGLNAQDKAVAKALLAGLLVAAGIEYILRGRHSVMVGGAACLIKKIASCLASVASAVFSDGGAIDLLQAKIEKLLRPMGQWLDAQKTKAADVAMIIAGIGAVIIIYKMSKKGQAAS